MSYNSHRFGLNRKGSFAGFVLRRFTFHPRGFFLVLNKLGSSGILALKRPNKKNKTRFVAEKQYTNGEDLRCGAPHSLSVTRYRKQVVTWCERNPPKYKIQRKNSLIEKLDSIQMYALFTLARPINPTKVYFFYWSLNCKC